MRRSQSVYAWRHLPAGIGAWLALVAGVNAMMVFYALHTFPGEAGGNAFDISNHYNAVLQSAEIESKLGWKALVHIEDARPVVTVTTSDGLPLKDAAIEGVATRPVGPENSLALSFTRTQNAFVAGARLAGAGNWDIALTIHQQQHALHLTRRVFVK